MKKVFKILFGKPEISLTVWEGMEFIFPLSCLIELYGDEKGKIMDFEISKKILRARIEISLLEIWGFRKWDFDNLEYYEPLLKVLLTYIQKELKTNCLKGYLSDNIVVHFSSAKYPAIFPDTQEIFPKPAGEIMKVTYRYPYRNGEEKRALDKL